MNKKIYFIVANNWTGTAYGRGYMVSNYLKSKGYQTECFIRTPPDIKNIKDSIIVFIKHHDSSIAIQLKSQNNKLVLDVADGYHKAARSPGTENSPKIIKPSADFIKDYFDAYILSNKKLCEDTEGLIPECSFAQYIYEKWDPKLALWKEKFDQNKEIKNSFRLGYIGSSENALYNEILESKENLKSIYNFEEMNKWSAFFTCHISIRKENTADFLYKPPSKISTAAAVDSNIIHTKDNCALELAGPEYPYYTDSDIQSVINVIRFARESFGSKTWETGLEIMKNVKERTHIDRICGVDYINFFRKF